MIIGIDFGTTSTVAARIDGDECRFVKDETGEWYIPSMVAMRPDGSVLVGNAARRSAVIHAAHTVSSIKWQLGQTASANWGDFKTYPQEISALILGYVRLQAERCFGEAISGAVLAVPAHFDINQRWATMQAAEIAGIRVLRLVNEATAAAMAYGKRTPYQSQNIAVFDFGGGTFDVSILDIGEGVFVVLATGGDTQLGGDDLDQRLIDHVAEEFRKEHAIDLRQDQMALRRLKEAAERAKCELSTVAETEINLPFITTDSAGPKHIQMKLNRAKLEELTRNLVERLRRPCEWALEDARCKKGAGFKIDEVVLVGGQTRMPVVQSMVKEVFGKEPNKSVHPEQAVAVGAAYLAQVLASERRDTLLLDVIPRSLSVGLKDDVPNVLIPRNTTIPTRQQAKYTTSRDGQDAVTLTVYEGDQTKASANTFVGQVMLTGLAPAPAGVPVIGVAFEVDAAGTLSVSATDEGTGKSVKAEMTAPYRLNAAQMQVLSRKVRAALVDT